MLGDYLRHCFGNYCGSVYDIAYDIVCAIVYGIL